MIKLIASDLDGTLLLHGAQMLRTETCGLIHRLYKEKGIYFVSASGRQYDNQQRLFAPVADEIAYICENGCLSFFEGDMLHLQPSRRRDSVIRNPYQLSDAKRSCLRSAYA